jgi:hypothetical protein
MKDNYGFVEFAGWGNQEGSNDFAGDALSR